jgi:hypothetical protein
VTAIHPRPKQHLSYLTRLETVSSFLAARFLLRDKPTSARTLSAEPVNPASAPGFASRFERGQIRQPDPAFAQSPGLIHRRSELSFIPLRTVFAHGRLVSVSSAYYYASTPDLLPRSLQGAFRDLRPGYLILRPAIGCVIKLLLGFSWVVTNAPDIS